MTMPKFEPVAFVQSDPDGHLHLAEITKTEACQNLDQWDRQVGWKAVPLHTADQLTEAYEAGKLEQAAQIEMMREALEASYNGLRWWIDSFPLHVTEADNEEMLKLVKALSTTPDQALEQFAANVREQCAKVCENEYPHTVFHTDQRAAINCANAIRAIKELP